MNIHIHTINDIKIGEIISEGVVIQNVDDALDLLGNIYYADVDRLILHENNITPDFFDLKNKMAGEVLQKFSNYRIRIAMVGDFSKFTSQSLKDFIFESNKGRQVNFLGSVAEALKALSDT